jgi:hypothetical protein
MISNPCEYKRRYTLAKEFLRRSYPYTIFYLVEVLYKGQQPGISSAENPRHLQIYTDSPPLWHKENALNVGIRRLLPKDWRAVAWIDADIEFENVNWAKDTLKILGATTGAIEGMVPIVCQLFSHALDLNSDGDPMTIFQGFGYQSYLGKKHGGQGLLFWHPGYAWACNRSAYEQMGGLYEHSILGSGDHNMALGLIGITKSVNSAASDEYKRHVEDYVKRLRGITLRYTPGVIRHYFHGSKVNRKYVDRWKILVSHKYDPYTYVKYDSHGILTNTSKCPPGLLVDIFNYFAERNEDE